MLELLQSKWYAAQWKKSKLDTIKIVIYAAFKKSNQNLLEKYNAILSTGVSSTNERQKQQVNVESIVNHDNNKEN